MKTIFLVSAILFSSSVLAENYQPLFDSCSSLKINTQSNDAQPCRQFISGFMAAASLNGIPSESNLESNNSEFFQRAYESRLGSSSLEPREKTCNLPSDQNIIISDVANNLPNDIDNIKDIKLVIINALRSNQECGIAKT